VETMAPPVGCYTNCFGPGGVRAAAEGVRAAGFDALELALRPHDHGGLVIPESAVLTERSGAAEVHEFLELLDRHGVRVNACNAAGADILTDDGLEVTLRRLRFARQWFDAPVVVTGAGRPAPGDADARTLMVRNLRRLGDEAAGLGMVVALETHAGPTQNADAMIATLIDVDRPAVRLNFDTGNIAYYNPGGDPLAELQRVKDLVRNVHLKDNRGRFEDWYFPALGDGGAVDFAAIRHCLEDAGYSGAYAVELEGIGGEPEPGLGARIDRIARSARHLAACGYFPTEGPPR